MSNPSEPNAARVLKVIACGVFQRELAHLAALAADPIEVALLDAGLHSDPPALHRRLAAEIEATTAERYRAVALAYGLCGRAVVGLVARDIPLVVPRVHDCIAMFIGDVDLWWRQFRSCPGTVYFTPGWCEKGTHPDRYRIEAAGGSDDPVFHPQFAAWAEDYGEANAAFIADFHQSWRQHYQRVAFINNGLGEIESYRQRARELATAANWRYEELPGKLDFLAELVGDEPAEARFLRVPPGHRVVATHDARLIAAVPSHQAAANTVAGGRVQVASDRPVAGGARGLGLGVDAGGTFTDAVLLDLDSGQVLSKAKAATTPHDLASGVDEAVGRLDAARFGDVRLVSLSTTLATNAIVEGRGARVGLLLMPWNQRSLEQIEADPVRIVPGRLNIDGEEVDPVDAEVVRRTVRELLADGVEAFAVSGYAGTHNPVHEQTVRQLIGEVSDLPVVCGHELSSKLDFIRRAHTAVLNARLLPVVDDLMTSVEQALRSHGVAAPLFVVRGDGSLIDVGMARRRPIETLLSGPAASAGGARFLTGQDDVLAVDVGGTTTDVAIVTNGRVAVCEEGPTVGAWRTSVAAVDILTSGLGGDSHLQVTEGGLVLSIGPRRAVPLSTLAARYAYVREELAEVAARAQDEPVSPVEVEFFELVSRRARLPLTDGERALVDLLSRGPASRRALAEATGALSLQTIRTQRLEDLGVVRRAAVTPTDVLHVLERFDGFDGEAARLGVEVLAACAGRSAAAFANWAHDEFVKRLAYQVLRRELSLTMGDPEHDGGRLLPRLFDEMLDGRASNGEPYRVRFEQRRTVVGIGAPAAVFLPDAGRLIQASVVVPEHAEVANAVGACVGKVTLRAAVSIRPDVAGVYYLLSALGRGEYSDLESAQSAAGELVVQHLRSVAADFGTAERAVTVETTARTGRLSDGSDQLIELRVEGLLEGTPSV